MAAAKGYLIDMDGVLVRGRVPIPGAQAFLGRLRAQGVPFLVLTNNPMYTPRDLSHRLAVSGLEVPAESIFTSAMATAAFLKAQRDRGTAFVVGETGLTSAIHDAGYVLTDHDPEYVVLGETLAYNFETITKAVRLVAAGARFIATNPDASGPAEEGMVPACGAMAALIQTATGREPFFIGKPNPYMMRSALNYLGIHSEEAVMIGDRMDTDIVAGVEAGLDTVLVLSGMTRGEDIVRYPFRPGRVVDSVADIEV